MKMAAFLVLSVLSGWGAQGVRAAGGPAGGAVDHGIPAPVSEPRGVVTITGEDGRRMIVAFAMDVCRTSLVLIDADTGASEQFWYPDREARCEPNYCVLHSSKGRIYVMFGGVFLEFDPARRKWTFAEDAHSGTAMSMTEADDGIIYAGTYPSAHLLAFDPATRRLRNVGRLDPSEKYPSSLAADSSGWVYAGLGTARCNLVAMNVRTGERRQLADERDRKVGTATVFRGADGHVYGRLHGETPWLRLSDGEAEPVPAPAPRAPIRSIRWQDALYDFPDGSKVTSFSLHDRTFTLSKADGTTREVSFDYSSEGAMITSMGIGPGGLVFGSTAHPFRLFSCDPRTGKLINYGGLKRVGGGNFCALASVGNVLYGAAYTGGRLYAFDAEGPWRDSDDEEANPKLLAQYPGPIGRPRALLAHPDGRHLVMAGFPGYGRVGGGMAIYDLRGGETALLTDADLLPGHSTVTLKTLPDGDLVAGTSILTPGGGHPKASAGRLYILDWPSRKVAFDCEPVAGARDINCVAVGENGIVYGLTDQARLFAFDPVSRKVIGTKDLRSHGLPIRPDQSLLIGPDGRLLILLSASLIGIGDDLAPSKLADLPAPATAGAAIAEGRIYYAAGSHVWSLPLVRR